MLMWKGWPYSNSGLLGSIACIARVGMRDAPMAILVGSICVGVVGAKDGDTTFGRVVKISVFVVVHVEEV